MDTFGQSLAIRAFGRREVLTGLAVGGALVLAGGGVGAFGTDALAATPVDPGVQAVRRLMALAASNAFAKLTVVDGFWDSPVARVSLPVLFRPSGAYPGPLAAAAFRDDLQHRLNTIAQAGPRRIAPIAARSVTRVAVPQPADTLHGGPTSATTLLRQSIGARQINLLIPALTQALRRANDPVIEQARRALKSVSYADIAHALANETDNAIWYQIGAEEAAIRRDPAGAGDPMLARALMG